MLPRRLKIRREPMHEPSISYSEKQKCKTENQVETYCHQRAQDVVAISRSYSRERMYNMPRVMTKYVPMKKRADVLRKNRDKIAEAVIEQMQMTNFRLSGTCSVTEVVKEILQLNDQKLIDEYRDREREPEEIVSRHEVEAYDIRADAVIGLIDAGEAPKKFRKLEEKIRAEWEAWDQEMLELREKINNGGKA